MTQPHSNPPPASVEEVEIQGHIIDSLLLPKVLDEILTHGGIYVLKDIRIGQRQTDPSFARIEVRAPTTECCRKSSTPSTTTAPCRPAPGLHASSPPTWTAPSPKASTARPTIARRSGCGGEWIEVEDQEMDCGILIDPEGAAARCLPMALVRKGDQIVVGRQGLRVLPAEIAAPAQPVRVHGQPGLQREAQGRDRPRDRRRHAAHARGRREDPGRARARRSSTPAASSTSAG